MNAETIIESFFPKGNNLLSNIFLNISSSTIGAIIQININVYIRFEVPIIVWRGLEMSVPFKYAIKALMATVTVLE